MTELPLTATAAAAENALFEDLGLSLTASVRPGRPASTIQERFLRELTEADLAMPSTQVQTAPGLVKIRDSHHALARVLATGMREQEAAAITGYSASRISILKADPQFAELLEFYRGQSQDVVADFRTRMVNMGLDALQELHERLDASPEKFSEGLLTQIVKEIADRTGHAPQRGPTNVTQINVGLSDKMAAARERTAAARAEGPYPGSKPTIPVIIDNE